MSVEYGDLIIFWTCEVHEVNYRELNIPRVHRLQYSKAVAFVISLLHWKDQYHLYSLLFLLNVSVLLRTVVIASSTYKFLVSVCSAITSSRRYGGFCSFCFVFSEEKYVTRHICCHIRSQSNAADLPM